MERLDGLEVENDVRDRVRFLVFAHRLTEIERVNVLLDGSRPETSAEHSWHLALCATVLAREFAPQVNLERVLKMVAIHDLVEIEVGDVPLYEETRRAAAAQAERGAAHRIFAGFPDGPDLLELWREFDEAASDEARFARAIDRLQPMLLHWAGGGLVWREHGRTRETLDGFVGKIEEFWPPLAALAAAIVADAARHGDFDFAPDG
jgi:putative hydrolases of HD superfamily